MYTIRQARDSDAEQINSIIHRAFKLYADELKEGAPVVALVEPAEKVLDDIKNNRVFVAVNENREVIGSIRYMRLSQALAYVYRFGVDPYTTSTGIGSDLLKTVIDECVALGFDAIALHTNSKYYQLARYYYGKQFYVHSTSTEKGYIRALFIKDLTRNLVDLTPALSK